MDALLAALGDPTRRKILDLLKSRERAAGELVGAVPHLSQPAVSRHLRVLREAGLVNVRGDAQRRLYSLRPDALAELDFWLSGYRQFWAQSLDALGRHLDARAAARPPRKSKKKRSTP